MENVNQCNGTADLVEKYGANNKGPGIRASTRVVGSIYLFDVLHTFCDLAEIEAPPTNEGISFPSVLYPRKNVIQPKISAPR